MNNVAYYEKGGDGYKLDKAVGDSRIYNMLLALQKLQTGCSLLDIGCGDMHFAKLFPNLKWIGLDVHEQDGVIKHDISNTPYPFDAESFDGIVCSEVLEHLFEPVKVLQEAARLLKAKGRLHITVPSFTNLDFTLQQHMEQVYVPYVAHSVEHIRNYTVQSMTELVIDAGFDVLDVIGNSPHCCRWLKGPRIALKSFLPDAESVQIDHIIGRMFPTMCAGFMLIAEKR